jgi:hypothetical protein
MGYLLLGALGLGLLLLVANLVVRAEPRTLVRGLRYLAGAVLILFGGLMIYGRRVLFGSSLIVLGLGAIYTGRLGPLDFGVGTRSQGRSSSVRSRFVEATLDRDSGTLKGRVVAGTFAGRELEMLSEAELRALHAEAAADPDSMALVEAYLDRRFARWREHRDQDQRARTARPADAGAMGDEEAYQILGLSPGAGDAEIRAAHRRLMQGVHPDRGGSTFLAARINEAKDRLLGKHG